MVAVEGPAGLERGNIEFKGQMQMSHNNQRVMLCKKVFQHRILVLVVRDRTPGAPTHLDNRGKYLQGLIANPRPAPRKMFFPGSQYLKLWVLQTPTSRMWENLDIIVDPLKTCIFFLIKMNHNSLAYHCLNNAMTFSFFPFKFKGGAD